MPNTRRFCATVRLPGSGAYTAAKLVRASACARRRAMSTPSMRMTPEVGSSTPRIMLMVVVLPAPLGPSRPTISLRRTSNEMPSTASVAPYAFLRSLTESTPDIVFSDASSLTFVAYKLVSYACPCCGHLPQHLPQHSEPNLGVSIIESQPAKQSADFGFGGDGSARFDVTAGTQHLQQHCGHPLHIARSRQFWSGGRHFGRTLSKGGHIARQFIQAHRHRLPQIHRDVLFPGRNPHQPMAVAEIGVGQPDLLRTEQQRHAPGTHFLADDARRGFQPSQRVLQLTVSYRRGADHQRAVSHRFRHAVVQLRGGQDVRRAHRGTRLSK